MKTILSKWTQALTFLGGKKKVNKPDPMTEFFHSGQKIGEVKTQNFFIEGTHAPIYSIPIFPEDRIEIH